MASTDQILEKAAHDGSISLDDWVKSLQEILQRLHDIVHTEFPIPPLPLPVPEPKQSIDPEVVASTPPQMTTSSEQDLPGDENELPSSSQKENVPDAPTDMVAGRPPETGDSQRTEEMAPPAIPNDDEVEAPPGTLPPDLLSSYQMSRRVLEEHFSTSPPYTVQRLAELVLRPKRHYRYLPAYLRALDRVVSVSSPVSDFPLPNLHNSLNGGFLSNGEAQVNGISESPGLGSDESLGGALLTPIPWLRNQTSVLTPTPTATGTEGELHSESTETIEGPHGAGSIETVSVTVNGISSTTTGVSTGQQHSSSPIASPTLSEQSDASTSSEASGNATEATLREQGGVTQGELLRQEQEAGVVPVNPHGHPMTPRTMLISGGAAAVGREVNVAAGPAQQDLEDEEQPHARGPETIGMEDMGPQPAGNAVGSAAVLDMEAAVGRGRNKSPQVEQQLEDEEMGEPGAPGQDPKDVEKEVERLKEVMDREKEEDARDEDGDVVVAGVDGKVVGGEGEENEGDAEVPDAVDASGQ